jgi:FtsP/CotA-like multicopper oxidase with cupredoxin domain
MPEVKEMRYCMFSRFLQRAYEQRPMHSAAWSRRQVLLTALSLAAAAGCGGDSATPLLPSPPNPNPAGAFPQPELRVSHKGVLETTLRAVLGQNELNGKSITTRTYGGLLAGPTLRLQPGDLLRVDLRNDLPPNPDADTVYPDMNTPHHFNSTNLHTHGFHVSPSGNSDNIFVDIPPGGSMQYEYRLPADHPEGTYWYHPHRHGAASMQLFGGMGGVIIISGALDLVPEVLAARDLMFLIQELNINPDTGLVPEFVPNIPPNGTYPLNQRHFIVNGQTEAPTLHARPGEVVRLRVVNGTVRGTFPLAVEDHELHILALDGITLPQVRSTARGEGETLAAGNRVDLLIRAGAPGNYKIFKRPSLDTTGPPVGVPDPEVVLAYLQVEGEPVQMGLPTSLPAPRSLPDIKASEVTFHRSITFSQPGGPLQNLGPLGPAGSTRNFAAFAVDAKRFDPNRIDHSIPLGSVEEWTLFNTSTSSHPFHIHVNPFQVLEVNGVPLLQPEWRDTVSIPKQVGNTPGSVKIRHRFTDFKGLYVFHCHILLHEDLGMMQTVNVY